MCSTHPNFPMGLALNSSEIDNTITDGGVGNSIVYRNSKLWEIIIYDYYAELIGFVFMTQHNTMVLHHFYFEKIMTFHHMIL